jgi:hypothetical protein
MRDINPARRNTLFTATLICRNFELRRSINFVSA